MSSVNNVNSTANQLKISGMATGLDTDSMVKQMLSPYQTKVDKIQQDKQIVQWKQEEYRKIIKEIKELQDYFNVTSDKYILKESKYNPATITNGNEMVVKANTGTTVERGTYHVKVNQLASGATIEGSSINTQYVISNIDNWKGKEISFSVNGSEKILTLNDPIPDSNEDSTVTNEDLVAHINNQISANSDLNGKVLASYVKDTNGDGYVKFINLTTEPLTINDNEANVNKVTDITNNISGNVSLKDASTSSKLTDLGYSNGNIISFDLTYGTNRKNINITVGSSTTLNDVLQKINIETSSSVSAKIDSLTGKVSMKTTETGSSTILKIENATNTSNLGLGNDSQNGKDAIVEITTPGGSMPVSMTQKNNTFTYNDISYTVNSVGQSDITVSQDADKVVNNITDFIDKYNSIVEDIQKKLVEKKNFDYKPLTDAQKEGMSEDDIAKWETKAKEGILKNDSNLQNLLSKMRLAFFDPVYYDKDNNEKVSLHLGSTGEGAIGLDTSNTYSEGGKIFLDPINGEAILKNIINNNTEDFMNLFNKSSDDYDKQGIFQRIDGILREYVGDPGVGTDGTSTYKGLMNIFVNKQYDYSYTGTSGENTLPDQIYRKELAVKDMLTKMSDQQEKYYQRFAALETAMNSLNSQSNWLYQQLGISSK